MQRTDGLAHSNAIPLPEGMDRDDPGKQRKPTRTPPYNAARIHAIGRSNTVKPVTTAIQGAHSHVHQ